MLGALVIGAAFALAHSAVDLDAQLRTEARAYESDGLPGTDLELGPRLVLRLRDHDSSAAALYTPLLFVHEGGGGAVDGLHRVELRTETHSRRWSARASANLSYGQQDFTLLAPPEDAPGVRPQLVPQSTQVGVLSGGADASATYVITRRARAELGGGYLAGGGLDARARAQLPLQRSPHAFLLGAEALSRTDVLDLRVDAEQTTVDPGSQALVATQRAELQHKLDPDTSLTLAVGVGELQNTPVNVPVDQQNVPLGTATLTRALHAEDHPATGTLSASVEPFVDRLTGEGYQRGEVRAVGGLQLSGRLHLGAGATFAQPVATPERAGELLAMAELGGTYALSETSELGVGVRALHERLVLPAPGTVTQLGTFAALTITEGLLSP